MWLTTSAEKVEKVVRLPRKPVIMSNFHSFEIFGLWPKVETAIPIMKPPPIFTTSVPSGKVGVNAFNALAKPHRESAPKHAPTQIIKIDQLITLRLLDHFK